MELVARCNSEHSSPASWPIIDRGGAALRQPGRYRLHRHTHTPLPPAYSACGPLDATLSPMVYPSTPSPTAITLPTLQYPNGNGWPSLLNTACSVGFSPSVLILSSTCFTLSGCWRAFWSILALPNSTSMRSVPRDTRLRVVLINTQPRFTLGAGTSSNTVSPVLND